MKKIIALIFVITFLSETNVISQVIPPYMWVASAEGNDRLIHFDTLKKPELERRLHRRIYTNALLPNFWGFVTYLKNTYSNYKYLRVYIGICDSTKNLNKKDSLIFIFAPSTTVNDDIGDYFILHKPFVSANFKQFKISPSTKKRWTDLYETVMPERGLDYNDRYNRCAVSPGSSDSIVMETKSVVYCAGDLDSLNAFLKKHMSGEWGNKISMALGAYPKEGVPFDGAYRYKNRTVLQLTALTNAGRQYDLQRRIADLDTSKRHPSMCEDTENKAFLGNDLDNGQLCPYYCPRN